MDGDQNRDSKKNPWKIDNLRIYAGIALISIGAIFAFLTFRPILSTEVDYIVNKPDVQKVEIKVNTVPETKKEDNIVFLNPNFGISIPKIGANADVIFNVDPYNAVEYNKALENGVAHAKGTSLPGQQGNVFLFAHSAVNFYESRKYNVYFYLLGKLKKGDNVYISYQTKLYKYEVEEVKIVDKSEVKYMSAYKDYDTLTLMTCWPAGLDINRMIVTAKEVQN